MIYNLVYEPLNKNHGKILLGKYDSKHFDSIENAEGWAKGKEIKPVRECVGSAGEDKPPLLVQKGGIYHLISTAEVIAHIHHRVVPIVYLQSNLIGRFLSGVGRHRQHHCQQSQECKFVSTKRLFHIQL